MAQDGTQAIRRAAAILQRIARVSEAAPPTLREISRAMDLPRSTTHRILKCLTETGLADYDPQTRRYEIGLLSYELGLAVTDRVLDLLPLRRAVDRVAARTGATSYLMRRSGIEAVCIHKADGTAVIRVIPVEVGQRRFMGVGAGATALLAELDDAAVERILAEIEGELDAYADLSADRIRRAVQATRERGYAESARQVYSSTYGLGVAVRTAHGQADFAVSIAAHAPEVSDDLIGTWRAIIDEEIARATGDRAGPGPATQSG
ncbi:IclR family transcriptional regulator [Psychromarinibacter sp. C21-152]|uniref:IclR family transcriptional regulator n=1 Tax=Psychromarinibacter sediminicola TaxID=3033385 RepID=A0AAE3NQ42_9RHOB|nr:IclR family transcriptional regulator [Psychromarinibacter sediminicola]MDF0599609.1 IclR family transcriptional regulator [Psychromarinibacter sediminicola]